MGDDDLNTRDEKEEGTIVKNREEGKDGRIKREESTKRMKEEHVETPIYGMALSHVSHVILFVTLNLDFSSVCVNMARRSRGSDEE